MNIQDIDVNFDFTKDTPNYWKNFWQNRNGLGGGSTDPDAESKTLQIYHQLLYSRILPNGTFMELKVGKDSYHYLTWENYRFGSDSIIASFFNYIRYQDIIKKARKQNINFNNFIENYYHETYTIGGEIIFPKRMWGINQSRGCNKYISDRFDLTLECIRKYYKNEKSPLYNVFQKDYNFFELFNDFEGYVKFFFLEDLVSDDFSNVLLWKKNKLGDEIILPETVEEYYTFLQKELDFVIKRNNRINKFIKG